MVEITHGQKWTKVVPMVSESLVISCEGKILRKKTKLVPWVCCRLQGFGLEHLRRAIEWCGTGAKIRFKQPIAHLEPNLRHPF